MKKQTYLFSKLIFGLFSAIIIIPIITMVIWTFTERWAWPNLIPQVFSMRAVEGIFRNSKQLVQVFSSSILISVVVALLSVIVGTMTARALVFYEFKGKNVFYFLTILPFMVPATVFAMGIQVSFIKMGLNNTIFGVIIAHLICSLPYAVRLLMDGTIAVGNRLEEQARVLGASPWKAFFKVTLPVLMPVVLSSFSMAYIVSFSQYFLTLLIGGGQVKTFTIIMVPYLQSGERNIASVYSMIFLGITMIVFVIFEWIAKKMGQEQGTEFYS